MKLFTVKEHPPQHKVLIHFHEADLHLSFVTDLIKECKTNNINVSITVDDKEGTGLPLDEVLQKIEESKIALVIFTQKYTGLIQCSRELDKIEDCWEKGTLIVLPIDIWTWTRKYAVISDERSLYPNLDSGKINETVRLVKKYLNRISRGEGQVRLSDSEQLLNDWVIPYTKRSTYKKRSTRETGSFELKDLNDMENMLRADTGEIWTRFPWEGSQVDPSGLSEAATLSQSLEDKYKTYEENTEVLWKVNKNVERSSFGILECLWDWLKILFLFLPVFYLFEFRPSNFGTENSIYPSGCGRTEKVEDKSTNFCYSYERTHKVEDKDTNFYNSYERTEKVEGKDTNFCYSTCTKCSIGGKVKPPNIQVFINFRGDQLRRNFISYLVDALQRSEVNVFIDKKERKGEDLNKLFKRIEGSGIAIVVFSSRYAESHWCLDELVKIRERALEGQLKVLPIYYNVNVSNVKRLKGDFGDHFRDMELMYKCDQAKIKRWKEAISFVSQKFALSFDERSTELESEFVRTVVEEVLEILQDISTVKCGQSFGSE